MASKRYRAAGSVVLRDVAGEHEVLVVHRPRYDDWSLPKGAIEENETSPATAVREVREETGYQTHVISALSPSRYLVKGRSKIVTWWLGALTDPDAEPLPNEDETDEVEWWSISRAISQLSYETDVAVLVEALRTKPEVPLLIVRHAKAIGRKQWDGPDQERVLSGRGENQAKALVDVLSAFNVRQLASSTSTRCTTTFEPYAQAAGLSLQTFVELSEEAAAEDPRGVEWAMAQVRGMAQASGQATAICGHRPVLSNMLDFLGIDSEHVLEPAELLVMNLGEHGEATAEPLHLPPEV